MEVRGNQHQDCQTIRQWAKLGYLPKPDAEGVMLWANAMHQNSYLYFAPEQVELAIKEQLHNYF